MLEAAYLVLVFAIGLVVSAQDIRKGFIKNGLLTVLMLLFAAFFSLEMGSFAPLAGAFLYNLLLSSALSVAMWAFGLWPSGDSKLFIVLSAMLPPQVLASSASPLSDMLINSFVPLFFFYFLATVVRSRKPDLKASLKKAFEPYRVAFVAFIYLGIAWFISALFTYVGITSPVLFIIILFVTVEVFYRTKKINLEYLFIGAAALRLVIDYRAVYEVGFLSAMTATVLVFIVFRFFFLDLAFIGNTRLVKIKDLMPGMKLAEGIVKRKDGTYEKKRIVLFTIYDVLRFGVTERFIHGISDEGLTEKEVGRITSLAGEGKLSFDEVLIHVSVPMAMFLFAGFFLTVLANGSFLALLKVTQVAFYG